MQGTQDLSGYYGTKMFIPRAVSTIPPRFTAIPVPGTIYSSGSFSVSLQIPQGQAMVQKPQPMQRSALTIYSYSSPSSACLEIAFCGQRFSQTPQSRQAPQDAQEDAQEIVSSKLISRGS